MHSLRYCTNLATCKSYREEFEIAYRNRPCKHMCAKRLVTSRSAGSGKDAPSFLRCRQMGSRFYRALLLLGSATRGWSRLLVDLPLQRPGQKLSRNWVDLTRCLDSPVNEVLFLAPISFASWTLFLTLLRSIACACDSSRIRAHSELFSTKIDQPRNYTLKPFL